MKRLKVAIVLLFSLSGVGLLLADRHMITVVSSFSTGPPAGFTGAPDENSCFACHSADVGMGTFVIVAPANYQAGQTYQIQVRHTTADTSRRRWGFRIDGADPDGVRRRNLHQSNPGYTSVGSKRPILHRTHSFRFRERPTGRTALDLQLDRTSDKRWPG